MDCTIYVVKTKALISCAVTVNCAFVFAYAESSFSYEVARIPLVVLSWSNSSQTTSHNLGNISLTQNKSQM